MASYIYNAWVSEIDTVFNPAIHARTEMTVTTYKLDQLEGGVAQLTMTCKNPGIGLLAPGRDPYVLISFSDNGETPKLIFRGVANSMPSNLADKLITLEFLGQPDDFEELLLAFARTKVARPYVDELISGSIADITDPAVVLEARSELFHVDPVTHEITLSDVIDYDRLIDIGPHFVRESLQPSLGAPPVRKATMRFVAEWTQQASGEVDIAWRVNWGGNDGRLTLTDVSSIGESGDLDNSGWSVGEVQQAYPNAMETNRQFYDGRYEVVLHQNFAGKDPAGNDIYNNYVRTRYGTKPLAMWRYKALTFPMSYDFSQPRREIIEVTATADVQDINAFGWKEEDLEDIGLNSLIEDSTTPVWEEGFNYKVGDKVIYRNRAFLCQQDHTSTAQFQDLLPEFEDYPESLQKPFMRRWVLTDKDVALKDAMAASFAESDRGRQIAEHGLLRVRAFLRRRMRALTVSFRGTWEDLHDITLRDGCRIEHPFFDNVGGSVTGKVIAYSKVWTGEGRVRYVDVTIGVSVANGIPGTLTPGGTGYSEAFDVGYSWADSTGVVYELGDMSYQLGGERVSQPVNPRLLKYASYACVGVKWKNLYSDQMRVAVASQARFGDAVSAVAEIPTSYQIIMRTLTPKDVIERKVTVTGSTVTARKDINLAFGG